MTTYHAETPRLLPDGHTIPRFDLTRITMQTIHRLGLVPVPDRVPDGWTYRVRGSSDNVGSWVFITNHEHEEVLYGNVAIIKDVKKRYKAPEGKGRVTPLTYSVTKQLYATIEFINDISSITLEKLFHERK